jgi:putative transposase
MPRTRKLNKSAKSSSPHPAPEPRVLISDGLIQGIDEALKQCRSPDDILGQHGLLKQMLAKVVGRALDAEMSQFLGYSRSEPPPSSQPNRRNGTTQKLVRSELGPVSIETPRDRQGNFEPQLLPKHERELGPLSDKIISMYSRGMSTRDIQAHFSEIYGTSVSPEFVSRVVEQVTDEVRTWQQRPLDATYLIVYVDALIVKIRDKGSVQNRAMYIVVGVGFEGRKDVLGLWLQPTEGAKFWLSVLNDLRTRGVRDILVLCADGLVGLPEAVQASFPQAIFQTCVVHMVRASLRYVAYKDLKAICTDLRSIYTAPDEKSALEALQVFSARWSAQYPTIAPAWTSRWQEFAPFLAFPSEIRRAIYTTNAIESLNRFLRKALKTRTQMPNDDAALRLVYLAIQNAQETWGRKPKDWNRMLQQFAIHFGERLNL